MGNPLKRRNAFSGAGLRRLRKILAQRSEGPKVRPASRRISHLKKVRKTIVALVALAPAGELGFSSDYLNL
jgi:hypothetical protein